MLDAYDRLMDWGYAQIEHSPAWLHFPLCALWTVIGLGLLIPLWLWQILGGYFCND